MNALIAMLIIGLPQAGTSSSGPWHGHVRPASETREPCDDRPDTSIATFEDANLEAATRAALSIGARDDLTCGLVRGLSALEAPGSAIESLAGMESLTSLTELDLQGNSITDISALSGLTNLTLLSLAGNSITDISPLSGLTSLTVLDLQGNAITDISALTGLTSLIALVLDNNPYLSDIGPLSGLTSLTLLWLNDSSVGDIQPLLDNPGLGAGDTVDLGSTNVACADVAALRAKQVVVMSDCPGPLRVARSHHSRSHHSRRHHSRSSGSCSHGPT